MRMDGVVPPQSGPSRRPAGGPVNHSGADKPQGPTARRYGAQGHKAQECPQKKGRMCTICGDRKHKKAGCPYCQPPKVEVEVDVEVCKEVEELGKMTLLD